MFSMEKSGKGLSGESVDILVGKIFPLELEMVCGMYLLYKVMGYERTGKRFKR